MNPEMLVSTKRHLEWDHTESCPIGRDPRSMSMADLEALGHCKRPLLQVIRQNCIECSGGSLAETRRCGAVKCPMWPFRMGSNPFAASRSEAQMATAARNAISLKKQPKASARKGFGERPGDVE
jgi:hypothetical protein